jgi:ABC-2 type transport system permease protein
VSFARESSIVFRRQIRMNLRNPAWVLIGIMQPVLYPVLFGPLLKPLVGSFDTGTANAYTFLVPGLLVQLGMFGAFFAGFALIGEWREGVIEAERVTPASRSALLVGRLMRDVLQLLVQGLILVGLGLAMGLRGSAAGILLPMTLGPAWLETASDFMPFRYVVDAVRDGFAGDLATSAVLWGTLWAVALAALGTWWGTATFRRENA